MTPMEITSARGLAALDQLRTVVDTFPEMEERPSHGTPAFFVRGKKALVYLWDDHHGDGRLAIWCKAPPGVQAEMIEREPDRFFSPPYMGPSGWLGVELSVDPDWDEVKAILTDAYRLIAPKTLIAQLDDAE